MADQRWIATGFGGPEVLQLQDFELPAPSHGEVSIKVRAVGLNPIDYKRFEHPGNPRDIPIEMGDEVAGIVTAVGPSIGRSSFEWAVGDEVIAFRVKGGYSTAITVRSDNVFRKPKTLGHPEAANLLLAATTASEMLHVARMESGGKIILHGAAGGVGVSVLQQARVLGVNTIGIAHPDSFDQVRRFGGRPLEYGPGLAARVRSIFPSGVDAALDTTGSAEAIDLSEELVSDRSRIVTIAAPERAAADGLVWIVSSIPRSNEYRDGQRAQLVELAAQGMLEVPIAAVYPFRDAREALDALAGHHPFGKLALVT